MIVGFYRWLCGDYCIVSVLKNATPSLPLLRRWLKDEFFGCKFTPLNAPTAFGDPPSPEGRAFIGIDFDVY